MDVVFRGDLNVVGGHISAPRVAQGEGHRGAGKRD